MQLDLNVFRGSYDFAGVYIAFMLRPHTQLLKICVSLGDTGKGIIALYFMLTGSIFQFVIK